MTVLLLRILFNLRCLIDPMAEPLGLFKLKMQLAELQGYPSGVAQILAATQFIKTYAIARSTDSFAKGTS